MLFMLMPNSPCFQWDCISGISALSWCNCHDKGIENEGTEITSYCNWRERGKARAKTGCAVCEETKQPLPFGTDTGKEIDLYFLN